MPALVNGAAFHRETLEVPLGINPESCESNESRRRTQIFLAIPTTQHGLVEDLIKGKTCCQNGDSGIVEPVNQGD